MSHGGMADMHILEVSNNKLDIIYCIPWRPATSTRSGYRRSGMVVETVYETARVFQTTRVTINAKTTLTQIQKSSSFTI